MTNMKRRQTRNNSNNHGTDAAGDKPEKYCDKKKTSYLADVKREIILGDTLKNTKSDTSESSDNATKRRGRSRANAESMDISGCLEQIDQLKKKRKQNKPISVNFDEAKRVVDIILSELIGTLKAPKSCPASDSLNVDECIAKLENLKKRGKSKENLTNTETRDTSAKKFEDQSTAFQLECDGSDDLSKTQENMEPVHGRVPSRQAHWVGRVHLQVDGPVLGLLLERQDAGTRSILVQPVRPEHPVLRRVLREHLPGPREDDLHRWQYLLRLLYQQYPRIYSCCHDFQQR